MLAPAAEHFDGYHPMNYSFLRQDGRTFLYGLGMIATVSEIRADGSRHDLAAVSNTHHFSYGCRWNPPQAYIDAFYDAFPDERQKEKPGLKG